MVLLRRSGIFAVIAAPFVQSPSGATCSFDVAPELCVGALGFYKYVVPDGTGNNRSVPLNQTAVGPG